MATTRIMAKHAKQGRTIAQCLTDRKDYAIDFSRTEDGRYTPHTPVTLIRRMRNFFSYIL